MSDTTAPILKRLSIPHTIDLSNGRRTIRVEADADDGPGGSGVDKVTVFLDKSIAYSYGAFPVIGIPETLGADTFHDDTPGTASLTFDMLRATAPGTYGIQQVWVDDVAGNRTVYDSMQLAALGIATTFDVVGGIADSTAPALLGLQLPRTIDVSAGTVEVMASASAQDNAGGAGVRNVKVYLDHSIMLSTGLTDLIWLGEYSQDTFTDATPLSASLALAVTGNTAPGTYHVRQVVVEDFSGNVATYNGMQLEALGIATSMEIRGGRSDTAAPVLHGLEIPAAIDIGHGTTKVTLGARATDDGGSGIDRLWLYLDKGIVLDYGTQTMIPIPDASNTDTFDDATPGAASNTLTIDARTPAGVYRIDKLQITDGAGNQATYDAQQLQMMGIRTAISVGDGTLPTPNASVTTTLQDGGVVFSIGNAQWDDDSFALTFAYDATLAHFAGASLSGMVATAFSSSVSESGGIGTVTIKGAGVAAGKAGTIDIALKATSQAPLTYAVSSYKVDTAERDFGSDGFGKLYRGSAQSDRIVDDGALALVDGGAGLDTVVFAGKAADYAIHRAAGGFEVASSTQAASLLHVERIAFADTAVALDVDGVGGRVYRLYQAAFDRKPDVAGLGFWIDRADHGTGFHDAAAAFVGSREFSDTYGAGLGNAAFAEALYRNVLHRAPDKGGVDFWIGALDGGVDRADVLLAFSDSGENVQQVAALVGTGFAYTPWS